MKLKLLAVAAFAAYQYDKRQVRSGKPSMFSGMRNVFANTSSNANIGSQNPNRPM